MGMKRPKCKEAADADWRQHKYARSFRTARIRAPALLQSPKLLPAAIATDVEVRHLAAIIDAAVEPEVAIGRVVSLVAIALVAICVVPAAIDAAAIVLADSNFHGTGALVDRYAVVALPVGAVAAAAENRINDLADYVGLGVALIVRRRIS